MYATAKKIFLLGFLLIPCIASATGSASSVWRDTAGFIRPLQITDFVQSPYFLGTSTTHQSTFPLASTTQLSISSLLSGNCLQSSTGGLVTDTGSPCSSGGSFSTTSANYWSSLGNGFSTTSTAFFSSLGLAFSTTSADYWKTANNFFSTTSTDFWASLGRGFSTTSSNYWSSLGNGFSTTSSNYWASLGLGFSTTSQNAYQTLYRDFSVQGNGYLAPTTTRGIVVAASSTIGDGTVIGGLTVNGTASTTNIIITGTSATSTIAGGLAIETSGFVYDYSSNNVGIGTTTPWARLSVDTSSLGANSGSFAVGSSTRTDFSVDQGGRVQVGLATSTPGAVFTVSSVNGGSFHLNNTGTGAARTNAMRFQKNGTNEWGFGTDVGGGGGHDFFFFDYKNGVTAWSINSTDNFVFSTAPPAAGVGATYLCLSTASVVNSGATCAASSKKVKNSIAPITGSLAKLIALKPVGFSYNKGFFGGKQALGFIAEDVAKVDPRLAINDEKTETLPDGQVIQKGDPMALDTTAILSVTVGAVQELNAKINAQQKIINELTKRIEALEKNLQ